MIYANLNTQHNTAANLAVHFGFVLLLAARSCPALSREGDIKWCKYSTISPLPYWIRRAVVVVVELCDRRG